VDSISVAAVLTALVISGMLAFGAAFPMHRRRKAQLSSLTSGLMGAREDLNERLAGAAPRRPPTLGFGRRLPPPQWSIFHPGPLGEEADEKLTQIRIEVRSGRMHLTWLRQNIEKHNDLTTDFRTKFAAVAGALQSIGTDVEEYDRLLREATMEDFKKFREGFGKIETHFTTLSAEGWRAFRLNFVIAFALCVLSSIVSVGSTLLL
jgi:hypothetical protein